LEHSFLSQDGIGHDSAVNRGVKRRTPESSEEWLRCAVRYLARFDRTAAQVESFLLRKGALPGQVKETIRRLLDLRYLDDGAYARRWVEARLTLRPMGRVRLEAELLAKGVPPALVEAVVRDALRNVGEEALARQALYLRTRKGRRLLLRQAATFLRRRGFTEQTIEDVVRMSNEIEGSDS
jgi:regulatory protein